MTAGEAPKAAHGASGEAAAPDSSSNQFAIVFAAMGVNMETAHFFKQVGVFLLNMRDAWHEEIALMHKAGWAQHYYHVIIFSMLHTQMHA